jgi:hypothetical protein
MDKRLEVFYWILDALAIGILLMFLQQADGFPFPEHWALSSFRSY